MTQEVRHIAPAEKTNHGSMDRQQLIRVLTQLDLPAGQYVVFGGSCLVVRDLRTGDDVDIFVTRQVYDRLRQDGWDEQRPTPGDPPLLESFREGVGVHAFYDWEKHDLWQPDVKRLIDEPEIIDGFPFIPLSESYVWKAGCHRPKDVEDLDLIQAYWRKQMGQPSNNKS